MVINILVKILPGIVVAVFSSFLASKWAMNKFYTEKWWDRKEKAYTEIINALYDLVQYYNVYKEDYGQRGFISKERAHDLHQRHTKAFWSLRKATDLSSLYVSPKATEVLTELKSREIIDFERNPRWEVYEEEFNHHKVALDNLLKLAGADLRGKKI
jgi:hypothetical protein